MELSKSRLVELLITENYDVSAPLRVRYLGQGANENYLVETSDQSYVLRIYQENSYYPRNANTFRFELHLLRFLNENDVAVVSPVVRKDGHLLGELSTPEGSRCTALFGFMPGELHTAWYPDFEPTRVRQLGRAVAGLHQAAGQFQSPYSRYHFDLYYLLDEPLRLLEERLKNHGLGDLTFFQETAQDIRQKVSSLGKDKPVYGIIHADLHVGNILYDDEEGYGIIDFDQCAYGWRAYDLATFMRSVATTVPENVTEIQSAVLEGYESLRPLTPREKEALPTLSDTWILWDIGETLALSMLWGGSRRDLTEKQDREDYLREAVGKLTRMTLGTR